MKFSSLGDSALTVNFTDESSNRERLLARALSVAEALEGANVPGVIDVTSAYESVALFFDPARIERDVEEKIREPQRNGIERAARRHAKLTESGASTILHRSLKSCGNDRRRHPELSFARASNSLRVILRKRMRLPACNKAGGFAFASNKRNGVRPIKFQPPGDSTG